MAAAGQAGGRPQVEPAQKNDGGRSCLLPSAGVEKLCFSEPSSVLATADAATAKDGERGRGEASAKLARPF